MSRRLFIAIGLVLAAASWLMPAAPATATNPKPVGQVASTTTTTRVGLSATTSTTALVLPTTVADTGVFSVPLLGGGMLLVGIGLSLRGKRAPGAHYVE